MPGVTGVTVVTNARVFYTTRAAAGASGARHSLRPLISEGRMCRIKLALIRGEIAKLWLDTALLFENWIYCREVWHERTAKSGVSPLRHSGAMRSIEPGISRFRVRIFDAPRNDVEIVRRSNQTSSTPILPTPCARWLPQSARRSRACGCSWRCD